MENERMSEERSNTSTAPENSVFDGVQDALNEDREAVLRPYIEGATGPVGITGGPGVIGIPSTEAPRIREMRIEQLNNGYIVRVGCHVFAFHTKKKMLKCINSYVNDPVETERRWFAGELF